MLDRIFVIEGEREEKEGTLLAAEKQEQWWKVQTTGHQFDGSYFFTEIYMSKLLFADMQRIARRAKNDEIAHFIEDNG